MQKEHAKTHCLADDTARKLPFAFTSCCRCRGHASDRSASRDLCWMQSAGFVKIVSAISQGSHALTPRRTTFDVLEPRP